MSVITQVTSEAEGNKSELGPNTVRLTFLPSGKSVEFESGTLPYQDHGKPQSILDVAINCGLHLEHACGGNCACTTCHVLVKKGKELLSECTEEEADRLDTAAVRFEEWTMKWLGCALLAAEVLLVAGVMKPIGGNIAVLLLALNSVLLIWFASRLRRKPSCCR